MSKRVSTPIAVSVSDAARLVGVSRSMMYMWIDRGRVRAFEYPGMRGKRILVAELEALVKQAADQADAERESVRKTLRMVRRRG